MARLNMKPYCICSCHKMPEDYGDPFGHIAQTCPCRARVTSGRFEVQNPPLTQLDRGPQLRDISWMFEHHFRCAKWNGHKCTCKSNRTNTLERLVEKVTWKETNMNKRRRLDQLKRSEQLHETTLLRVEEEIAQLEAELAALPEEPPEDAVVAFLKPLGDKTYSWVAYRAHADRWYLSQDGIRGAQLPSMTWDELCDFIDGNEILIATAWEKWS